MMKKNYLRQLTIFLLCLSFGLGFAGCGLFGSTDRDFDGEEIDMEYLTREYPQQLLNDGGKTITGSITLTPSEKGYTMEVQQKKVVVNEDYDDGYYIADRNMTTTHRLNNEQALIVLEDGELTRCDPERFSREFSGNADTLYTVYLVDDTVELILPLDPEELVSTQN